MKRYKKRLDEVTRKQILVKNRVQSPDRYNRRMSYKVTKYDQVDIVRLFEDDYFIFRNEVNHKYVATVAFHGVFSELKNVIKTYENFKRINLRMVIKAISRAFDKADDVLVDCTCPDFCLAPGTEIKLLDGRSIKVEDLLEEFNSGKQDLWCYSVSEDDFDFRPGHITDVWISGYTDKLVEVTLDNGEVIKTTPEHRYMLRDGSYCEAQNLKENQSLMPLYFQNTEYTNGYETVKYNSKSHGYNSVYKEVAKYELQNQIEEAKQRSKEDTIVIHHKNFNKLDNRPENLYPMGKNEHWMYHANFINDRRKQDKEFCDKIREASRQHCYDLNSNPTEKLIEARKRLGKERTNEINNNPEKRAYVSQRAKEYQLEYWGNMTSEERLAETKRRQSLFDTSVRNKKLSDKQKQVWSNYTEEEKRERGLKQSIVLNGEHGELIDRGLKTCCANIVKLIYESGEILNENNYEKYRKLGTGRRAIHWQNHFDSFKELLDYAGFSNYNHKVVSVKVIELDEKIPVYDLTVDRYNNFLVSAGVILHNCYRFAYFASENGFKFGDHEKRPSKITNPHDSIGATCKHLSGMLSDKKWMTKAASYINKWIKAYPEDALEYILPDYADKLHQRMLKKTDEIGTEYDNMFDRQREDDDFDDSQVITDEGLERENYHMYLSKSELDEVIDLIKKYSKNKSLLDGIKSYR